MEVRTSADAGKGTVVHTISVACIGEHGECTVPVPGLHRTPGGIFTRASAHFPLDLDARDLGDGFTRQLLQPFVYRNGPILIEVPRGFVTDYASIPRVFWRLIPPTGPYNGAAVIHDYLYTTGTVSRIVADAIFVEAMAALGVPANTRTVMHMGVRLGGRRHYHQCNVVSA